jgi:hypothetical protein
MTALPVAGPQGQGGRGRRAVRRLRSPAAAILLLAPFCGESLSGSTPPLDLVLPWNLALMTGLYGSGALICREAARRFGLGLPGLILLGAAYGVYEEALIDRYWFYPHFWNQTGVGTYSEVWRTNLLLAVHLTAFHAAVSICIPVLIVERLFPAYRQRAWAGRGGLTAAVIALGVLVPVVYGEFHRTGPQVLIAAGGLCVLLAAAAFLLPRRGHQRAAAPRQAPQPRQTRRGLGVIAFCATAAHFTLVYALPGTGIPWPAGIALAVAPVAAGVLVIHRSASGGPCGPDGLRVVTGIVSFFVLLDVVIGLGGRYDLSAGGVATALGLWWLHTRARRGYR